MTFEPMIPRCCIVCLIRWSLLTCWGLDITYAILSNMQFAGSAFFLYRGQDITLPKPKRVSHQQLESLILLTIQNIWAFFLELSQIVSFIWNPYKTIESKRTSEKKTLGNCGQWDPRRSLLTHTLASECKCVSAWKIL